MITMRRRNPSKWDQAGSSLRAGAARLDNFLKEVMNDAVEEGAEALRGAIEGSDSRIALRLRQLDRSWSARKGTDRQLFNEGDYAESITTKHEGKDHTLYADGDHPSGLKNSTLARYLEEGTRRMEPIPHWKEAAAFVKRQVRDRLEREVRDVLRF